MNNDASLARMILDQRNKLPKRKLQKAVNDIAKQALERDCKREFGQDYVSVLRRANRALRAIERDETPDPVDTEMMVWIGERAKFFEVIADKLGVDIEV